MPAVGVIPSPGIAGPVSSVDYAVALWSGTLGDTLQSQANLLVESGLIKVRQSGGIAGVDELQFNHDGTNGRIRSMSGNIDLLVENNGTNAWRMIDSSGNFWFDVNTNGSVRFRGSPQDWWSAGENWIIAGSTGRAIFRGGYEFRHPTTSSIPLKICYLSDTSIQLNNGTVGQVRDLGLRQLFVGSLADASASNSSLYFSTDAGALVWKDSGGTVHALY